MKKFLVVIGLVAVCASLIACGGSKKTSSPTKRAANSTPSSAVGNAPSSLKLTTIAKAGLGKIVVGHDGQTVYMFAKDTEGKLSSTCSDSCASVWPPVTVKSTEGISVKGVSPVLLSTFTRPDGSLQVALNGWPLYYYAGDTHGQDTTGQSVDSFGAEWHVLSPDGKPIKSSQH